jgi:hypothetical protein
MQTEAVTAMRPLKFSHAPVPGLISVVWPSRQRTAMAAKALRSLSRLAADPSRVEYGVAYDADDPGTGEWAAANRVFAEEFPERLGWAGHAEYSARLFERSWGEWILSWGDDGIMLTRWWDKLIRSASPGVLYLGGHPTGHNVFPAVHRSVLEAIGTVLPSPHQDTWLTEVAQQASCLQRIDVRIMEDRFDLTGNNDDAVWREGSIHAYRNAEYFSSPMAAIRAEHAQRVRAALA